MSFPRHREPTRSYQGHQDASSPETVDRRLALVNRYIRDYRKHGKWARASRAGGYYTAEDLDALFEEYMALIAKYGHSAQDAPPGARPMQLRMFYIPDEPAP
jgi:hypothetical protein